MGRAAVAIGVDKTGNLPELNDAARGAERFADWARSQNMDPVTVITDEDEKVTLQRIKDAIAEVVDSDTAEQLIVYFAGHGVNIRYGEYWLLSDAPRDTQAAVNVSGSVTLAKYCGIPHVVLISDACRTAAEGIQAQFVTGGEIFPNEGAAALQQPVDQFFACTLGRPAHEIKNPHITAHEYKGLYTQALLESLSGQDSEVIDWSDQATGYVRPEPLKQHLYEDVTRKITQMGLQTKVVQVPDAQIVSSPDAWIAVLDKASIKPARRVRRGRAKPAAPVPPSPTDLSRSMLRSALSGGSTADLANIATDAPGHGQLSAAVSAAATPFGPQHHETACGFKIRGAMFADTFAVGADVEDVAGPMDDLRVTTKEHPKSSVLLTLDTGASVVLPAVHGFLCALTVDGEELVDVAYEPSEFTDRWGEFSDHAEEVRTLRAVAAASTRDGVFRLDGPGALELARRMQYAKGVDPALAIYAAHAYQRLQRQDLIAEMVSYMRGDLGSCFFDIAMLAGEMRDTRSGEDPSIMGFMPLLAQGWAQLSAYRVALPNSLDGIQSHLLESPWTLLDVDGADIVRNAIEQRTVI